MTPRTLPALTPADLARLFPANAVKRGERYFREGKATVLEIDFAKGNVGGVVQGTRRRPYQTTIIIRETAPGKLITGGSCSCPVMRKCKHAVALFLQALEDAQPNATIAGLQEATGPAISAGVEEWLQRLEEASPQASEEYPPDIRQRLVYRLRVRDYAYGRRQVILHPLSARLLKDGSFSKSTTSYSPSNLGQTRVAKFLRPSDMTLLQQMRQIPASGLGDIRLSGREGAAILEGAVATGRCFWRDLEGPALQIGAPLPGRLRWTMTADGRQVPEVHVESAAEVLPLTPPWYLSSPDDDGYIHCGPVNMVVPPDLLAPLLDAPPLAAADIPLVRSRLSRLFAALAPLTPTGHDASAGPTEAETDLLPAELAPAQVISCKPTPQLHLCREQYTLRSSAYGSTPQREERLIARLSFAYGEAEITASVEQGRPTLTVDGAVVEVERDMPREREALARLGDIGFEAVPDGTLAESSPRYRWDHLAAPSAGDEAAHWLDFLLYEAPSLVKAGWVITQADDFPVRPVHADDAVEAAFGTGSGIDWFDLHLGVSINGERVDIVPALLRILRSLDAAELDEALGSDEEDESDIRLPLEDGRTLVIPFGSVRPICRALVDLFGRDIPYGRRIRLSVADAVDAAGLENVSGLRWRGDDRLRALGRRLADISSLPEVALPNSFHGTLRPYQQIGVAWMQLLREVELGGVLADDMGLGKTIQTLAHLSVEKAAGRLEGPCLIVVPTSLLPNWRSEAAAFAPDLSVLILHGGERKQRFEEIPRHDLILTTYPLLQKDAAVLQAQRWYMLILDEAQAVKNPATAAAKTLRRLEARHRLALTGTPLENHLGELWALFDVVSPGYLGDRRTFTDRWRTPIEKKGDRGRQAHLARRLRPFLLRRTKGDVVTDLPPKSEIQEHVVLGEEQRSLYESIRLAMHSKVREAVAAKGLARSHIELLEALLKLRQVCCDPRLVKDTGAKKNRPRQSAKLERLMEMLPELLDEGRRMLLFSQFTSMLDLIADEVAGLGIPYVRLTGQTRDRETPVRRFQAGEVPLFLISLKAGGTGLNLTAADTVIHYDPWWNPAVEAQASDRAHRIGQEKPVFVYKMVVEQSIEEKMLELKARKQALAEGLFNSEGKAPLEFSEDDIDFLLGSE